MIPITVHDLILTMAVSMFVIGVVSIAAGVFLLVSRIVGDDVKVIAQQTTKIAQKGLADDIAGLVGNASSLIEGLNQLIKTTSGIGTFLVVVGIVIVVASFFMAMQIL